MNTPADTELLHATSVAIGGSGVLLTGPSGAGKSDLALRLIDRGATLISDDQTAVSRAGDTLLLAAPERINGLLEVREVGIVRTPSRSHVPLALCVALDGAAERLPEPRTRTVLGVTVPEVSLDPHQPSAAIKVELVLRRLGEARDAQR